jgi:hypothetical protein
MCTFQLTQRQRQLHTSVTKVVAAVEVAAAVRLRQLTLETCSWCSAWHPSWRATLQMPVAALTLTTASTW